MPRLWYVEGRSADAFRVLLPEMQAQPGFRGAELLRSEADPGLWLLVSRWSSETPKLSLPGGTRAWVFEVIEEF